MAIFSISFAVSVEAESYEEALELQAGLKEELLEYQEVTDVYEIDVEQMTFDEE